LIGRDHMIDFPNHSRSYDLTRRAVRFWGHDSAIEASFFINEDALRRIQPDARPDESGFLKAFDSNRDLICAAAARLSPAISSLSGVRTSAPVRVAHHHGEASKLQNAEAGKSQAMAKTY
jgi:hypothetical protein